MLQPRSKGACYSLALGGPAATYSLALGGLLQPLIAWTDAGTGCLWDPRP